VVRKSTQNCAGQRGRMRGLWSSNKGKWNGMMSFRNPIKGSGVSAFNLPGEGGKQLKAMGVIKKRKVQHLGCKMRKPFVVYKMGCTQYFLKGRHHKF